MKKINIIVVVFILALVMFFCIYITIKSKENRDDRYNDVQNIYAELIEKNLFINIENDNLELKDINLISEDSSESFYDIILSDCNYKLIFYSGLDYCNSCVEYQLPNLVWMADQIGFDKVIVIIQNLTKRDIVILKNKYNIQFQVYGTQEPLDLPIEEEYLPFYF